MTTEIAKKQMCVQTRSGIELWINEEDAQKAFSALNSSSRFVILDGRMFNVADVVGIFKPEDMNSASRRKNGQWKCKGSQWHDRGEKCLCASISQQRRTQMLDDAAKNCALCEGKRFILEQDKAVYCQCQQISDTM